MRDNRPARRRRHLADQIEQIVGVPEVDNAVDCVGFEARGHGHDAVGRAAGHRAQLADGGNPRRRRLGIPGSLRNRRSRRAWMQNAKTGVLGIRIGLGWAKSHTFATGQCPVLRYNRQLMQAILYDKIQIAKAVNVQTITLDEAPTGYKDFDKGAAKKFVIDPHKMVPAA